MTDRAGWTLDAEILVVPDCPNEQSAVDLFREVLDAAGYQGEIRICMVRTDDDAARRGFQGSPTFLVSGIDVFGPSNPGPAVACRVYPTPNGLRGLPSRENLIDAVKRLEPEHRTSR